MPVDKLKSQSKQAQKYGSTIKKSCPYVLDMKNMKATKSKGYIYRHTHKQVLMTTKLSPYFTFFHLHLIKKLICSIH